jgi:hypothetical protein
MGVDEISLGKRQKFFTVVSNLETCERTVRKKRWMNSSASR